MSAFEEEKGLVGKIRAATESDVYDLAGYTEVRARDLIEKAFSSPLEACTEMVKFTFTIGGGKLVRSRYDDSLSKWIVSALRDLKFEEDRSAACDYNSQGTFKQQHDTGQNLKTISIFPFVACANANGDKQAQCGDKQAGPASTFSAKESAIISADLPTFRDIVNSKTESWSQRKAVLKLLQESTLLMQELEQKLIRGEMLSPTEQQVYDLNSGFDAEKIAWLQGDIKRFVDNGNLTCTEKDQLLKSMADNIATLDTEIESATAATETKKLVRLKDRMEKLVTRRASVERIVPITHKLKKSSDIQKIYGHLHNIHIIEDKGRSMSLTLADLKKIEPKFDLEQQLTQAQQMSRCWFESDEDFEERCADEFRTAKSKIHNKANSGTKKKGSNQGRTGTLSSGSKVSSGGGWSTKTVRSTGGGGRATKTTSAAGGFAAAFGSDSDSDSD